MMDILLAITILSLLLAAAASAIAWRAVRENRRRSAARVAHLSAIIGSADAANTNAVAVRELLGASSRTGPPRTMLAVVGSAAVFVAAIALSLPNGRGADRPAAAGVAEPVAHQPATLELRSLRDARGPLGELELTGVVHNPSDGATLEQVTAVALLFDRQGAFITSRRAPLESGGTADATFRITVPDADDVGRYRVSFRTDDGVVPHTDRRSGQ